MKKLPILRDELNIELQELGINIIEKPKACISCKYSYSLYNDPNGPFRCKLNHCGYCLEFNPNHNCNFWEEKFDNIKDNKLKISYQIAFIAGLFLSSVIWIFIL